MSEPKCPFCQQELREIYFNGVGVGYICPNPDCKKAEKLKGNAEFWQELIRTRKELDIRKKQVEIANKAFDFISTEWDNADCSRKELGACAFNAKEDIAGWESDIETALEQKE